MFKYTQKRDLNWLKETVTLPVDSPKRFKWITHLGVEIVLRVCLHDRKYYILDKTGYPLAHVGNVLVSPALTIDSDRYFEYFPFNNNSIGDFIDTVWFLLHGIDNIDSLFKNRSGKIVDKAVDIFKNRLDTGFNSVDNYIFNRLFHEDYELILNEFFDRDINYRESFLNLKIPYHAIVVDVVSMNGEPEHTYVYNATTMFNLGYVEYEDVWVSKVWLKEQQSMGTCQCGKRVKKAEMYGHRCKECLKCPIEKITIHDYNAKADQLLDFKGLVAKKKKGNFQEYYQKYLKEIGTDIVGGEDSTIYIGAELEYECRDRENDKVEVLEFLHEHAILKSDGTINNGFEIVTKPATFEEHRKYFEPFFTNFPSGLHKEDNCGLHFHISRKPLSVVTQGKMVEFMNRKDNKPFIELIAERWSDRWAKQDSSKTLLNILQGYSQERYNALNTNNKYTLEFRIFAPSLTWDNFAYKMEFCLALAHYFKPCNASVPIKEATSHVHFKEWLAKQRKIFPYLYEKVFGINQKKLDWQEKLTRKEE